ncbi:MAG TPA: urease accessory protein [Ideonella sp.]|uniref:urease accessory protein UreH domain-containing protein n=1 Tax=Ideonella sp. TaxID=1929293 RepID=UPI002E37769E|nr:urease accessory protein [Ideonella sp.]HEX5684650.1 urease accessory protein [Ideonella sp.]
MTALSILFIGLLLGVQHATEADHLAAVATLATRPTGWRQAVRHGMAWGLGHTLTLLAFAGMLLVLGQVVSPALERGLETGVGMMLVLLGADVLRRLWCDRIHRHLHQHAQAAGTHTVQASAPVHAHPGRWPLRALAVGMMHGLAGSAALVLMSLQATPAPALGLGYVALFGLGSIAGMAVLSAVIALPLQRSARRLTRLHRVLQAGVGLFSCALGAFTIARLAC